MISVNINPLAISLGIFQIKWYGISYVLGFVIGKFLVKRIIKNDMQHINQNDKNKLLSIFDSFDLVILISIILGGRLGYFIFYEKDFSILDFLKIYQGGMSFYGAAITIFISIFLYSRKKKINFFVILDLIVLVAPVGIFLGRIANFINQELYGKVIKNDLIWAVIFERVDSMPRHPSQIYEAILEGLVLFLILFICRKAFKSIQKIGLNTLLFTLFYSVFRIISEYFRDNGVEKFSICQFITTGQILSILSIVICIPIYIYLCWKNNNKNNNIFY